MYRPRYCEQPILLRLLGEAEAEMLALNALAKVWKKLDKRDMTLNEIQICREKIQTLVNFDREQGFELVYCPGM